MLIYLFMQSCTHLKKEARNLTVPTPWLRTYTSVPSLSGPVAGTYFAKAGEGGAATAAVVAVSGGTTDALNAADAAAAVVGGSGSVADKCAVLAAVCPVKVPSAAAVEATVLAVVIGATVVVTVAAAVVAVAEGAAT